MGRFVTRTSSRQLKQQIEITSAGMEAELKIPGQEAGLVHVVTNWRVS